jgi:hypothetical protein
MEQFDSGEFGWMSDDVERVRLEDTERLRELGLHDVIDA